jgi:hypothetical protein
MQMEKGIGKRSYPRSRRMSAKQLAKRDSALTNEQVELGSKYLGLDNIAVMYPYKPQIKDVATLKRAIATAWEAAVVGTMEGQEGGYNDRFEGEAIDGIEKEIAPFAKDLKAGGKRAKYWIELLKKEVPFLFA